MVLLTHPTLEILKERGKIANEEDLGVNCTELIIVNDLFATSGIFSCYFEPLFVHEFVGRCSEGCAPLNCGKNKRVLAIFCRS